MPRLELKPIRESPEDYEAIEKEIMAILRKHLYAPLLKSLPIRRKLENSSDDLLEAIRSGRIAFSRGLFTGDFDSFTSRELRKLGAKFDRSKNGYRLPSAALTIEVRNAISSSVVKLEQTLAKIDSQLASVVPSQIVDTLKLSKLFDKTLWKTQLELKKSMKAIGVKPELTPLQAKEISTAYSLDLQRYIKDFTESQVLGLRAKVQKSYLEGQRYEGIIKTIQQSYRVSEEKAKFLARQETSLMNAAYKQARYKEQGIDKYKWRTVVGSPLHPVRPMHKKLNGTVQRFDSPPITAPNGARNNPGQDFNCRCTAIPIVEF